MIATTLQDVTYEMKRLSTLPEKLEAIEKKMEKDNQDICLSLKMTEEQTKKVATISTNTDMAVKKLRDELALERQKAKRNIIWKTPTGKSCR